MLRHAKGQSAVVIVALVVALVALSLASCSEPAQERDTNPSDVAAQQQSASSEVGTRDTDTPRAMSQGVAASGETPVESAALPRLVDLGADKCVPCKMMAPILEELSETYEGELEIVFIDVWKDRSAGEQYGVRVIPTQIFFAPDGSELFRHQGFLSREDILAKWSELGYDFGSTDGGE